MKTQGKMPWEEMIELRRKLAAGVEPELLLRAVEPYGLTLRDLHKILADATLHGAKMITFGASSIEIK